MTGEFPSELDREEPAPSTRLLELREALKDGSWTVEVLGEGLREAARHDDVEAMGTFLSAGADIDSQDGEGWSALKVAALVDAARSIRFLAERGGKVDLADRRGRTPLIEASWHHQSRAVRALLESGAHPDLEEPQWGPAIADTDCCECVKCLVEAGARIDVCRRRYLSAPTLLEMAAQKGRLDLMRQLAERGAGPSSSSLVWSARRGDTVALLWQLSQGAEVAGCNSLGETPLMGAAEQQSTVGTSGMGTCKLLLEHGADPTPLNCVGHAAAHKALMADDLDCLQFLLKFPLPGQAEPLLHLAARLDRVSCLATIGKAYPDQLNLLWNQCTPLMVAAAAGHLEVCQWLLKAGANTEVHDGEGATALFHAACYARMEVLQYLVKAGARLQATDLAGRTVLIRAADGIHNADVVPCLLCLGADADSTDRKGWNAALYASLNGKTDGQALNALLEVDQGRERARQIQIPFAQAALKGRVWPELTHSRASVVKVLLNWGADPREPHLVSYVQATRHQGLIKLLRQHGVDVRRMPVQFQPDWDCDH